MNNERGAALNGQQDVDEIDLLEIFGLLLHWIWLILLVAIVCGAAGYCYSRFMLPEEFKSTTTIYVLNVSDKNNDYVTQTELQAGSQLTKDYAQLITSRTVLDTVAENLGLSETYTYDQFKKKVSVSTPTDTRLVNITVTDNDPQTAQLIADDIRVVASDHIKNVMQIEAVNLVDKANLPLKKSAPNNTRNGMIWALIGALLISAILIIRHLLDDSIKTSDDIEKYLDLPTLAMIPLDANVGTQNKKGKTKKTKKSKNGSGRASAHTAKTEDTFDSNLNGISF